MTAISDPFFPGGMGVFPIVQNQFLVFEDGPVPPSTFSGRLTGTHPTNAACLAFGEGFILRPMISRSGIGRRWPPLALSVPIDNLVCRARLTGLLDLDGNDLVGASDRSRRWLNSSPARVWLGMWMVTTSSGYRTFWTSPSMAKLV